MFMAVPAILIGAIGASTGKTITFCPASAREVPLVTSFPQFFARINPFTLLIREYVQYVDFLIDMKYLTYNNHIGKKKN